MAGSCPSLIKVCAGLAADGLYVYLVEPLHKQFAVFSVHNGLYGSAEHIHAIFLQNTVLIKRYAAIQGRLSAKGQHDAVGTLFLYHLADKEGRYGQEINLVGKSFRRLHRGDIGVDKHRFNALFLQRLKRLRTAVIKLTGFAYL